MDVPGITTVVVAPVVTSNELENLTAEIRREHGQCLAAARASLKHAKNVGEHLLDARKLLKGKGFVAWVRSTCPFSYSSADNYMLVALHWDEFDAETLSQLNLTGFMKLVRKTTKQAKDKITEDIAGDYDGEHLDDNGEEHQDDTDQEQVEPQRPPSKAVDYLELPAEKSHVRATASLPGATDDLDLPPKSTATVPDPEPEPVNRFLAPVLTAETPPASSFGLPRVNVVGAAKVVGIDPDTLLLALRILEVPVTD